jgi:hypothetical protein
MSSSTTAVKDKSNQLLSEYELSVDNSTKKHTCQIRITEQLKLTFPVELNFDFYTIEY